MNSLYLNVTEKCNMRCEYCYGNNGLYYKNITAPDMSFEIACKAIEKAKQIYGKRLRVVFFGGEPLLCIKLIKSVVNKYNQDNIQFCIVTNGVLLEKEIIEFLVNYKFAITISFEGSELAQSVRKTHGKQHTYDNVLRNIEQLDRYNSPYNIRMTLYSGQVNLVDRIQGLTHLKNVREIRFQLCSPTGSKCDLKSEDFEQYSSSLKGLYDSCLPNVSKCRLPKAEDNNNSVCTMGITGFAVDAEGDVYPCYRFVGKKEFCLGRIDEFNRNLLWADALLGQYVGEFSKFCYADHFLTEKSD